MAVEDPHQPQAETTGTCVEHATANSDNNNKLKAEEAELSPPLQQDKDKEDTSADDNEMKMMRKMERRSVASDLEGLSRLSTDAVKLTTELVEAQHSRLDWFSNLIFKDRGGVDKVRNPIAAVVYNSIYAINGIVGFGLSLTFAGLKPILGDSRPSKRKDAAIAVLNGVVGDYLVKEQNPLAITMQWRTADGLLLDTDDKLQQIWSGGEEGRDENTKGKCFNGRLLLLVHGSCNSPHDWWQDGHNHGMALAEAWEYTPLFLHYNTGLHISDNGKQLSASLKRLTTSYYSQQEANKCQKPLSLAIVAHSMGGLVSRSACYYGEQQKELWLDRLTHLITLGTPHHGAVLEQGGKLVDAVLGAHHYTEPISWLGKIRSDGVMDLGYGNVRDEDWTGYSGVGDNRKPTPLPKMVRCLAIAAVLQGDINSSSSNRLLGDNIRTDGLVTQASALGIGCQENTLLNLQFDEAITVFQQSHVGLLSSEEVYDTMYSFLDPSLNKYQFNSDTTAEDYATMNSLL